MHIPTMWTSPIGMHNLPVVIQFEHTDFRESIGLCRQKKGAPS